MGRVYFSEDLKRELNSLGVVIPKRSVQGKSRFGYSDKIWFLINFFKKNRGVKK